VQGLLDDKVNNSLGFISQRENNFGVIILTRVG